MRIPLILITYGLSKKLCTWEEDGILKLPIFSEPILASEFVKSFKSLFKDLLIDKEELQIQICNNTKYATDMLKMIGVLQPLVNIIYNPSPLGQDAEEAIGKLAKHFSNMETIINKSYSIEEAIGVIESATAE